MIVWIVIFVITGAYMVLNFKYDLQMLQQNSYRVERYWRWVKKDNISSTWRLVDVALLLLLFSTLLTFQFNALIIAFTSLTKFFLILKKKYKKPLVFTPRVKRIYSVTLLLVAACFFCTLFLYRGTDLYPTYPVALGVLLVCCIFSWAFVMAAVIILTPVEKLINKRYYDDAARLLKSSPDLKIVGITGSYGKTSTKHYLQRILSEQYNVLMTPGSFNTPMGVIRTVREQLKPYHEIFICEMGAKQRGDIKEICDLVHPQMGIITAVGPMHLETFKNIEGVQATKFELADALPKDGLVVVNNDFEPCAERRVNNVKVSRYGVSHKANCDYTASDIRYSSSGTSFKVNGPDGFTLALETQLVGECNISNLLAAVVIALNLGVDPAKIQYAVRSIEQVEHRLNVKKTPAGVTIIDDAFNSNPFGSKMAVDVLSSFTGGKRIIVTPGMIELGSEQYRLNEELGQYIAGGADLAIIVGAYNREAILNGLKLAEYPEEQVVVVDSFNEAQDYLAQHLQPGDTILYENDLPDTFK